MSTDGVIVASLPWTPGDLDQLEMRMACKGTAIHGALARFYGRRSCGRSARQRRYNAMRARQLAVRKLTASGLSRKAAMNVCKIRAYRRLHQNRPHGPRTQTGRIVPPAPPKPHNLPFRKPR